MLSTLRKMGVLFVTLLSLFPFTTKADTKQSSPFLVKPYLQLGDSPKLLEKESLVLAWHTDDKNSEWKVEFHHANSTVWLICAAPESRRITMPTIEPHLVWKVTIKDLVPGEEFTYRVLQGSTPVFSGHAKARKGLKQPFKFVLFGDCAEGTEGQKQIAVQTYKLKPDFVFIPGDIVYTHGSISEYRKQFFPIYNTEEPAIDKGAPLLRNTTFISALGNHDVDGRDLKATPDGMSYFYYWFQPLNGPAATLNGPNTPSIKGPDTTVRSFLMASLPSYPRMASYSFDYGNSHWTVLDSNDYADWSKSPLKDWLEKDLESAKNATWRFVTYHHPGLGARFRPDDPKMMAVAATMTKYKVDIVFNGHVHTYFCSRPIRNSGEWFFDGTYNGTTNKKPDGTIYMVSGAGGAHLHERNKEMMMMELIARKSIPGKFSLTYAEVAGKTMTIRQVGTDGKDLDKFVIQKN